MNPHTVVGSQKTCGRIYNSVLVNLVYFELFIQFSVFWSYRHITHDKPSNLERKMNTHTLFHAPAVLLCKIQTRKSCQPNAKKTTYTNGYTPVLLLVVVLPIVFGIFCGSFELWILLSVVSTMLVFSVCWNILCCIETHCTGKTEVNG